MRTDVAAAGLSFSHHIMTSCSDISEIITQEHYKNLCENKINTVYSANINGFIVFTTISENELRKE